MYVKLSIVFMATINIISLIKNYVWKISGCFTCCNINFQVNTFENGDDHFMYLMRLLFNDALNEYKSMVLV